MELADYILLVIAISIVARFVYGVIKVGRDAKYTNAIVTLAILVTLPIVLLEIWAIGQRIHWVN